LVDLKSLVANETNHPATSQEYFLDGQALRDETKTLEQLNIKDGEMLGMMVSRNPSQRQQRPAATTARPAGQQRQPQDPAHIEQVRQQILSSPQHMSGLIGSAPDLAAVIDDPVQFRNKWVERISEEQRRQQQHDDEIRSLNNDPFDADAQRRIAEIIRRENIEKNLQYAYENNPAGKTIIKY
jgi:DNA damage-inducible protein 1